MSRLVMTCAVAIACATFSSAAFAQTPRNAISAGVYAYRFETRSGDLAGPLTPPGIAVSVADTQSIALIYTRRISEDWSANLALGSPPTYRLRGEGAGAALGSVGQADAISPAFIVQRHFRPRGRMTPFIGAGVAYTKFRHPEASASLVSALGGPTDIQVASGWSPTLTLGADVTLDERWFVTGSVAASRLTTDARLTTGPIERTISVEIRPVVYRLTIGRRF